MKGNCSPAPDATPAEIRRVTDLFYSDNFHEIAEANSLCYTCPIRLQCLDGALDRNERYGIWGFSSARARARVRKHLKETAEAAAQETPA